MTMREALVQAVVEGMSYEMAWDNLPEPQDASGEPLDFENFEMLDIDLERNRIHICCGGDWQDSHNFWCDFRNDHFVADLSTLVLNAPYKQGMDSRAIHRALGI